MHILLIDAPSPRPRSLERHLVALGYRVTPLSSHVTYLALAGAEPPAQPLAEAAGLPRLSPSASPLFPPGASAPLPSPPAPASAPAVLHALPLALNHLEQATRRLLELRRTENLDGESPFGSLAQMESFPDGLLAFDLSGLITAANPAAHRLLAAAPGSLPGQPGTRYVAPLPPFLTAEPFTGPLGAATDRSGHPLAVEASFIATPHDGTLHRIAVLRDLSAPLRLEREILDASERERRQIGRDLYDGVVQQIAAVKMLAQLLAEQLLSAEAALAPPALKVAHSLQEALQQASSLVRRLVPLGVFDHGLVQALQHLAAQTQASSPARCLFTHDPGADIADPDLGLQLYRIAQEAVAHALGHGQARTLILSLTREGSSAVLSMVDDGFGFPEHGAPPRSGLHLLRHRAQLLGARLDILRSPLRGGELHCRLHDCYPKTNPSP